MRWAWLSIEAVAVLIPPLIAFKVGTGEPETLWSNLAIITGSQAAATLVVAVLFASRFKVVTRNIGIDQAMHMHKVLGSSVVLFVFLHLMSVVIDYPVNVWLVDVFQAPARSLAGLSALIVLLFMLSFANRPKRHYEKWRWAHRISALLVVGLISWHIIGLNQLVNSVPWLLFFTALLLSTLVLLVSRWLRSINHKKYIVTDVISESPTASTITLRPVMNSGIRFSAGQFVWLRLSKYVLAEDHPFTIASSEYDRELKITFRHLGDWTQGTLTELAPGRYVWIDGPHGAMNLDRVPKDKGIALVAVGVGLSPVMSVLRTLADEEEERPVLVFISPEEVLFLEELAEIEQRLPNMRVLMAVERPITRATFSKHIADPQDWFFLICGPPSMVVDCKYALLDIDVSENQMLTEQFEIV